MMNTASIVISCKDRPGIVKQVTEFLFSHGANIANLEQHIEDGYFFMRVEWELENSDLQEIESFNAAFSEIKDSLDLEINVDFHNKRKRVALFCSKELHCLIDVLARIEIGELEIEVPYILSNYPNAKKIANRHEIKFIEIATKNVDKLDHEIEQLEIVQSNPSDMIALARYMKILSADFIDKVGQKIINVHHSFLPSFVGAKPYDEAHDRGVKLIGATSHYVIPELDQGPIIEQNVKRIKHIHDIESLKLLGRESEKEVFAFAIRKHIENKLIVFKNRVIVFE